MKFSPSKLFHSLDKVFAEAESAMDEAFAGIDGNTAFTSNNGHVVITGEIKSLRVNDTVVDPQAWKKAAS